MPAKLSAFVIWAVVAATVAFWALRLAVRAPEAPAHTLSAGESVLARADVGRLLGAPPAAEASTDVPAISSRFRLSGVMAPKTPGQHGVALIEVDGKMPRAFRVGSRIDGELTLQSVSLRTASIGPAQGRPAVVLELPPPTPPATGTLPGIISAEPDENAPPLPPVVRRPAPPAPAAPATMPAGRVAPPQHSRGLVTTPRDQGQAVQTR
ncbi:type II secretion system protein N [Piscinibacter sp.]|uniref:type II secretion system protein N n=1 Tax=Piscinibacter sp. TaxID=1903157 RepID=UPI002C0E20F6|nr:type II secretion system protein N [Albitalea sp.]HUG26429.1 type II secretion system protein N [Albitalea sp.]